MVGNTGFEPVTSTVVGWMGKDAVDHIGRQLNLPGNMAGVPAQQLAFIYDLRLDNHIGLLQDQNLFVPVDEIDDPCMRERAGCSDHQNIDAILQGEFIQKIHEYREARAASYDPRICPGVFADFVIPSFVCFSPFLNLLQGFVQFSVEKQPESRSGRPPAWIIYS